MDTEARREVSLPWEGLLEETNAHCGERCPPLTVDETVFVMAIIFMGIGIMIGR